MDGLFTPARAGTGDLSPKEFVKKFWEFFSVGTRREVLLLGDLSYQLVHNTKSGKRLCQSLHGVCKLCAQAVESVEVDVRQVEYWAPAFVRAWSERDFEQKVAVFSAKSGDTIRQLFPEGSVRGNRVEVKGRKQGSSVRYDVKALPGLPRDFPSIIPAAFPLEPFVRGRFGKPQIPGQEPLFLPAFRCAATQSGPPGMPRPLNLSAADFEPSPEELAEMKALLAKAAGKSTSAAAPILPATPTSATVPTTPVLGNATIKPEPGVLSGTLVKEAGPPAAPETKPAPTKPLPTPRVSLTRAARQKAEDIDTAARREAGAKSREGGEKGDRLSTVGDVFSLVPSLNGDHGKGEKGGDE